MKLKIKKNKNKETKASLQFLNSLITLVDEDLILTIKDRVLSPLYYQYDFPEVVRLMKKNKFKKIKRVYTYPVYKNLRNTVSYFYNKPNEKISKLLYGSGLINVLCKKMIKSIIIFGGSGLIGQEIIRYLQEFNLNILNADLKKSNNKNVNFLKCDVTKKRNY